MNTTQLKKITLQTLAFGMVMSLQACGGGNSAPAPAAVVPVAPAAPVAITPGAPGTDPIATQLVPQLQQYYGNINIEATQAITINSVGLPTGQIAWSTLYGVLYQAIQTGASTAAYNTYSNYPGAVASTPWTGLNYEQFTSWLYSQPYIATPVQFTNFPYQQGITLGAAIDMLIGANYNYYAGQNQLTYTGYNPYQTAGYNGNQFYGGLSINGGSGGFNLGGSFNLAR